MRLYNSVRSLPTGVALRSSRNRFLRSLTSCQLAVVRFLSIEPLIGPIIDLPLKGIHWVIVGGESGHGARPMNADWVRTIRDRCVKAKVAFFFKQWGGVQKSKAGRVLDKKTWDQLPTGDADWIERPGSGLRPVDHAA